MHEFWVESEGEAIQLLEDYQIPMSGSIFVGKRGTKRDVGHMYLHGDYFTFDTQMRRAVSRVRCPASVQNAVQHCTPDLLITRNGEPELTVEVTFHTITYNNVAQRLPRVMMCARAGFDSFLFQKVDKNNRMYNSWLTKALQVANLITPNNHCLPIFFDDTNAMAQLQLLRDLIESRVNADSATYNSLIQSLQTQSQEYAKHYDPNEVLHRANGQKRSWIRVSDNEVKVIAGVKRNCDSIPGIECGVNHCHDNASRRETRNAIREGTHLSASNNGEPVKCMWITKGTGGMDPYPGLALLCKLFFCYDTNGVNVRPLHVHFEHLPADFWWLIKNSTEVYYRTLRDISDTVTYK